MCDEKRKKKQFYGQMVTDLSRVGQDFFFWQMTSPPKNQQIFCNLGKYQKEKKNCTGKI